MLQTAQRWQGLWLHQKHVVIWFFVFGEVVEGLGDAAQLRTEFAESFYRTEEPENSSLACGGEGRGGGGERQL